MQRFEVAAPPTPRETLGAHAKRYFLWSAPTGVFSVARVIGIVEADIDPNKQLFQITLKAKNNSTLPFTCDVGTAEQMAAALSSLVYQMRQVRADSGKSNATTVAAEEVAQYQVTLDPWAKTVLLRFVNKKVVTHTFAIPQDAANGMAERLKTESAKGGQTGTA